MSDAQYLPGIPLRFVERNGKRILQQVWVLHTYGMDNQWHNCSAHYWDDVPLMVEGESDPAYWVREVKL
jgi:hypothetical protein